MHRKMKPSKPAGLKDKTLESIYLKVSVSSLFMGPPTLICRNFQISMKFKCFICFFTIFFWRAFNIVHSY